MKNLWSDREARAYVRRYGAQGVNADVARRVYTTRLLGGDPRLVLHGGGGHRCWQASDGGPSFTTSSSPCRAAAASGPERPRRVSWGTRRLNYNGTPRPHSLSGRTGRL